MTVGAATANSCVMSTRVYARSYAYALPCSPSPRAFDTCNMLLVKSYMATTGVGI